MKASEDFFARKKRELGVTLNEVQTKAIEHTDGPLLLLASPGSGKTTTIIMRIGYLIEEKGIDPSRIKAVTFSRASANDMKERFKRFFPYLQPVDFSTIHSLAYEVMREHFRKMRTSYQIIEGELDLEDQGSFNPDNPPLHKKLILRKLFQVINGEMMTDDQMDELTTYISYIKNKLLSPEEWSSVKVDVPEAERILREYEAFKKSGHSQLLIDYDDMLTIGNEVLDKDIGLLRKYQQRYDYVMTDESQDTSFVQHAIIRKLVQSHKNLCVVADDDQSIYSWRGAEPSYLLEFKQVYSNAVIWFMEQNYRSSRDIVHTANQFIKRNKDRYDKNMFTENPAFQPIKVRELANYKYQAKYLVREIQKIENLAEVAVLYRNNSSSISIMNEFDRAGVPFYMKDADNRFFSHWVVEDILNFMRMSYTDRRPDLLEKIHLKFNGYISKQQMESVKGFNNNESVFDNLLNYVQLQDYQVKLLKASKETFQQMREMPPLTAIRVIRNQLGYEKALEKMCERLGFRKEYLIGILNTLEDIADTLETLEEFANRLKHLESVLKTAKKRKGHNAVTFSTFHSSKGLEFEKVYMIDLIEGIIPSSDDRKTGSALNKSALMEEATRLFYVGMTRAKQCLELITYRERDGERVVESQYVSHVRSIISPPRTVHTSRRATNAGKIVHNPNAIRNRMELIPGKVVKHRAFGSGTIMKMNEERIHIRFGAAEKAFSIVACLEMGLLERIDAANTIKR